MEMNKEMSGIINKRENNQTKKEVSGHSLAVQWLGLCAFSAVVKVQSLVGELQSCKLHGLTKKKKKKKCWDVRSTKSRRDQEIAPARVIQRQTSRVQTWTRQGWGGGSLETLPGGWCWSREAKACREGRCREGHPGHSPPRPQVQEVQPITSYDAAGSFLLLGCNNGSIYYVGEQQPAPRLSESLPLEVGEEGKGWATLSRPTYPPCPPPTPATARCAEIPPAHEGQRPSGQRALPGPSGGRGHSPERLPHPQDQ